MREIEFDTMEAMIEQLEIERDHLHKTLSTVGALLRLMPLNHRTYELLEMIDETLKEVET